MALDCPATSLATGPDRAPLWPNGITGSISHAFPVAVAAVARTSQWRSLGIDVEVIQSDGQTEALVPKIVLAQEAELAGRYFASGTAATLIFSAKEAIYKAAPRGLQRALRFDSAILQSVGSDHLDFCLTPQLDYFGLSVLSVYFEVMDTHVLTLCAISG